jgi:hypothetical protein
MRTGVSISVKRRAKFREAKFDPVSLYDFQARRGRNRSRSEKDATKKSIRRGTVYRAPTGGIKRENAKATSEGARHAVPLQDEKRW